MSFSKESQEFNIESMSKKWVTTSVQSVCSEMADAPFGAKLKSKDYIRSGVPVIQGRNIQNNRFQWNHQLYVSIEKKEELKKHLCRPGDLVFPKVGTIGGCAILPKIEGQNEYVLSTNMMKINVDKTKHSILYLYYYFSNPIIQNTIKQHSTSSVQPVFNFTSLKKFPVSIPSFEEQNAIASILSSLDDKIDLNNAINKNLEEMAQALFKRWFVDFEFPNENGEPYKSSGGELEESELGLIPKGWKLGAVGDIAIHRKETVKPADIPSGTVYVGLEHVPRKKLALDSFGISDVLESNKTCFEKGDILFGKLRPYFHKVSIAPFSGVCSTDIIALNATEETYYGYLVLHLFSDRLVDYVTQCSNGTKMPRTKWSDISRYRIVIPETKVARNFTEIFTGIVNKMESNFFENQQLFLIRDSLLPKLMSGEIRVQLNEGYPYSQSSDLPLAAESKAQYSNT